MFTKDLQDALAENIEALAPYGFRLTKNPITGFDLALLAPDDSAADELLEVFLLIAAVADNMMPLNQIGIQGHFVISAQRLRQLYPEQMASGAGLRDLSLYLEQRQLG
jgi:hypothetical protein